MGILRDLHTAANNGRKLTLYDGTVIRVRAMSFRALEDLEQEFPSWLGRIMAQLEKGVALSPGGMDSQTEALLHDLQVAIPGWKEALIFILADSNPGLGVGIDWVRKHLHAPDIAAVLKAWVEENGLGDLLKALGKKVMGRLAAGRGEASSATSSSPSPAPTGGRSGTVLS